MYDYISIVVNGSLEPAAAFARLYPPFFSNNTPTRSPFPRLLVRPTTAPPPHFYLGATLAAGQCCGSAPLTRYPLLVTDASPPRAGKLVGKRRLLEIN